MEPKSAPTPPNIAIQHNILALCLCSARGRHRSWFFDSGWALMFKRQTARSPSGHHRSSLHPGLEPPPHPRPLTPPHNSSAAIETEAEKHDASSSLNREGWVGTATLLSSESLTRLQCTLAGSGTPPSRDRRWLHSGTGISGDSHYHRCPAHSVPRSASPGSPRRSGKPP